MTGDGYGAWGTLGGTAGPLVVFTWLAKNAGRRRGRRVHERGRCRLWSPLLSTVPSTFTLMVPRGRMMLSGAPNGKVRGWPSSNWPGLLIPEGSGSTETEMIELVTLPAIRP